MLTMVAVSESDRRTGEDASANSLKIAHDEKYTPSWSICAHQFGEPGLLFAPKLTD